MVHLLVLSAPPPHIRLTFMSASWNLAQSVLGRWGKGRHYGFCVYFKAMNVSFVHVYH